MFTIYKATNIRTNMSYIGYTSESFNTRRTRHYNNSKLGSKHYFHRALAKYDFTWEILDQVGTKELAIHAEKYYIKKLNTKVPNGYNLTDGGEGAPGLKKSEYQIESLKIRLSNPVLRSDGVLYLSQKAAAESNNTSPKAIDRVIKGLGKSAGGYGWSRADGKFDEIKVLNRLEISKRIFNMKKKVIDNFGNIYHSISDAARAYSAEPSQISRVVRGKRNSYKGIQFSFYKGE